MSELKTHDLHEFMRQITDEMSSEYNRIQKRALEDPGTAGDQGEENWAELLRDWLPRNYEVVTKGRIISQEGATSPQIDVLVLKGSYPKKMLNKKLYLAAGVAAAFECKTTLKAAHIEQAVKTCAQIKGFYIPRTGTPYKELHSPIIYGLLAHSHVWKGESSTPVDNVTAKLVESDRLTTDHPRLQLDFLCVADLATWVTAKMVFMGPHQFQDWSSMAPIYGPNGSGTTAFVGHSHESQQQTQEFTPIGVLISYLSQKMAWEDTSIRDLADYYRIANISGSGGGQMRNWPPSIYSDEIRSIVESNGPKFGGWDEWKFHF